MAGSDSDVKINGNGRSLMDKLKDVAFQAGKGGLAAGLAIYLVHVLVAELKNSHESNAAIAKTAHDDFLKDAAANREQMQKQWDVVREQAQQCADLQRAIRDHQAVLESTQTTLKACVDELKKAAMKPTSAGGGGP